jgi:hypothetical protein
MDVEEGDWTTVRVRECGSSESPMDARGGEGESELRGSRRCSRRGGEEEEEEEERRSATDRFAMLSLTVCASAADEYEASAANPTSTIALDSPGGAAESELSVTRTFTPSAITATANVGGREGEDVRSGFWDAMSAARER